MNNPVSTLYNCLLSTSLNSDSGVSHFSMESRVYCMCMSCCAEYCALLQTVSTASELRKPTYWIVAAKAIDYEQMLLLMAGVKWDIKEIMSQHNVYVDVLLKVMCCVVLNGFYVTWVHCLTMFTARTHVFIFRRKQKGHGQVKAALLKVRFNQVEKETKSCLCSCNYSWQDSFTPLQLTVNHHHHNCVMFESRNDLHKLIVFVVVVVVLINQKNKCHYI